MKGVFARWKDAGYEPYFVCGDMPKHIEPGVTVLTVPMRREITPWLDARCIVSLWRMLRKIKPVMVDASTPKAGLLVTVAAWLARVPVRLYTLRGLPLETARGFRAKAYHWSERLAAACANHMICISASLRESALAYGIMAEGKAEVVGSGSSNGVDTAYFDPRQINTASVDDLREQTGFTGDVRICGYIGRLNRDKGMADLLQAWPLIREREPRARL
ncbi:MAG: glycosyltransferase, partial [Verrucomicrobiota bacterium]